MRAPIRSRSGIRRIDPSNKVETMFGGRGPRSGGSGQNEHAVLWSAQMARPRANGIAVEPFGKLEDGRAASLFVLTTARGIEVRITNYGGILVAARTPDRKGDVDDIVLGFDRLEDYARDDGYVGSLIGRYANRIAGGRLAIDGVSLSLDKNEAEHHLHGGAHGFHKALWGAHPFEDERGSGVELDHRSVDGEGGYPGNLDVKVTYILTEDGTLVVDYRARSDRDTVVNLTQHSYFNLDGAGGRNILDHELRLRAGRFTPTDGEHIPTGEIREVRGTAFDFVEPRRIGSRIGEKDEQLLLAGGYDHNWILDGPSGVPRWVAMASSPLTGRTLEVSTTEPGLQFYTGNFLRPGLGKGPLRQGRWSGFCLEPQHFPDSPNKAHFPSTILRKGDEYRSMTIYRFSTDQP